MTALIPGPNANGFYSFELLGRKDALSEITDVSGTDDILPHYESCPALSTT